MGYQVGTRTVCWLRIRARNPSRASVKPRHEKRIKAFRNALLMRKITRTGTRMILSSVRKLEIFIYESARYLSSDLSRSLFQSTQGSLSSASVKSLGVSAVPSPLITICCMDLIIKVHSSMLTFLGPSIFSGPATFRGAPIGFGASMIFSPPPFTKTSP